MAASFQCEFSRSCGARVQSVMWPEALVKLIPFFLEPPGAPNALAFAKGLKITERLHYWQHVQLVVSPHQRMNAGTHTNSCHRKCPFCESAIFRSDRVWQVVLAFLTLSCSYMGSWTFLFSRVDWALSWSFWPDTLFISRALLWTRLAAYEAQGHIHVDNTFCASYNLKYICNNQSC